MKKVFKGSSAVILCTSNEKGVELNRRLDYIRSLPLQLNIPLLIMSSNLIQFEQIKGFSDVRMDILPFNNKSKTLDMVMNKIHGS